METAALQIKAPAEWAGRFAAFEQAETVLIERWRHGPGGVSRIDISRTFAAYGAVRSAWSDPAFRVWAALRGCVRSDDFLERWCQE